MGESKDVRSGEATYRDRVNVDWDRVTVGTHCVDCYPSNCPIYVFVKDGRVVREELIGNIEPVEDGVPDMNPLGCQKGLAWSRQLYSPDRLLHPLRRAGARGEGKWEQISWDEALGEVADAIVDAIEDGGPETVVYEGSPEIGAVVPAVRFMMLLGGTTLDVNASIGDLFVGLHQVFGKSCAVPSADDMFHSDCLFIWHANPAYTSSPTLHYMTEARYRGADVILVSPDVSPSHVHVDYHVPVRHGSDAALALAMCQVVLSEGLADLDFIRTQTDLSLLVRTDTGEFLRSSHLEPGGREDCFYHWRPGIGVVPANPGSLLLDFVPALEGSLEVECVGGDRVTAEPLLAAVRRTLDGAYTPEDVTETCGTHPGVVRTIARKVASGKTRILMGGGVCKYFHGDLMQRAMLLLLACTGNWGKKGSGLGGWAAGLFDGHTVAMSKTTAGVEGSDAFLSGLETVVEGICRADPTMTEELAAIQLMRANPALSLTPPVFFWYWHAGFRDRWDDPATADPSMPRPYGQYVEEAASTWWKDLVKPAPEKPPRVLLEIAGNMLRRTRGGQKVLLEHLWPKLDKVVCVDYRMSQTALYSDIVLPAAQHYEKMDFGLPSTWTMFLGFSDAAVAPAGEARSDWAILADLAQKVGERAHERGLVAYEDSTGFVRRFDKLWHTFTLEGTLVDDRTVADEMVRDAVLAGTIPQGTSLESLRQKGWTRYTGWGCMAQVKQQASPFPVKETHAPLRNHVELGHPYPTLTRRAQFLIDHPWYLEAGEALPVHKDPPVMGGAHPFLLSSGHNRWSVHAMNTTNRVLLETHRGKPFVLVSDTDAAAKGIADDDWVRIWNNVGDFVVAVRTSPSQRPGSLTVYNGFEGFMHPGGRGANECEPGLSKWLQLAAGYGHLTYTPTEWQPVTADRCVNVDIERIECEPNGVSPTV